jgi:hypothetical protein
VFDLGKGGRRVTFRGLRRQARAGVLVRLDVAFGACDGQLRRLNFRGSCGGRAGRLSGGNGLACVAHFLHRRAGHATEEASDTEQNEHVPQHRDGGH